jgi:lysophospholipase L1-like esterase
MKRVFRFIRDSWLIAGITLLLMLLIEAGFTIYYSFRHDQDSRVMADCYSRAAWVGKYFEEFSECNREQWKPYIYWRRQPFSGELINVGSDGLRKTIYPEPGNKDEKAGLKIFMFGGSALWGTGARDEYTIPSLVGSCLQSSGIFAEVVNFGESGYVSTQEWIGLMLEIQKGNVPDVVVFYDGVNDVFSAYQRGEAGIPQNEKNREKEFNALKSRKKALRVLAESFSTLSTIRFIRELTVNKAMPVSYTPESMERMITNAIHVYKENIHAISRLGAENGFRALFYWQPSIFGKENLTAYEKQEAEKLGYLKEVLEIASRKVDSDQPQLYPAIHNLSNFFQNEKKPIFIDYCHVGEYGNSVIAMQIAEDIVETIKK